MKTRLPAGARLMTVNEVVAASAPLEVLCAEDGVERWLDVTEWRWPDVLAFVAPSFYVAVRDKPTESAYTIDRNDEGATAREREVVELANLGTMTQSEIGARLGISKQRVSQLLQRARKRESRS